jgi:OOP family OmpA-OmpF porin
MKPFNRWVLVVLAVVVIAILLVFWSRRDQPQAPADGDVASQPDTPTPTQAEEPVAALVLFDFDQSVLRPGETPKLDELTAKLKGRAFDGVSVVGHADQIGTDAYNLGLSGERAEAVRAYLVGKGVDAGSIRTEARGEREAVTGEACKNQGRKRIDCLQPDRRVEVTLAAAR